MTLMEWADTQHSRPKVTQTQLVYATMKHGDWWTFYELRKLLFGHYNVGISEAGASARIRDLRKSPYNLTVERRPTKVKGVWEYRVVV